MGMHMDNRAIKRNRNAWRILRSRLRQSAAVSIILAMCLVCSVPALGNTGVTGQTLGELIGSTDVYAASISTSGRICAEDGAIMRSETTTDAAEKAILAGDTKVTIVREIFREDGKSDAENIWYLVKSDDKRGYVRSDLIDEVCYSAVQGYVTGKVNYRTGPSVNYESLGVLEEGSPVTVLGKARVAGSPMWYKTEIGGQKCYIRSKYVSFETPQAEAQPEPAATEPQAEQTPEQPAVDAAAGSPAEQSASSADSQPLADDASITVTEATQPTALSPGSGFTLRGSIASQAAISKVVAGVTDVNGNWLLTAAADVNAGTFDIYKLDSQIKFGTLQKGDYKYRVDVYIGDSCFTKINSDFKVLGTELAPNLLANPTDGGAARIVGTFNTSNCTRLFGVTGTGKAKVPQGMTLNGDTYYLVYGMSGGQAIVTYSSSGQKLGAVNFPFNMGHPNGITWDPLTGLCYIFRGYQHSCYTWNPATGEFGNTGTPYSSSGIAYDAQTNLLYASSRSGMREYSADGAFTHQREFRRCSHGGKTYVQDCGAAGGFIFHCVSGANKHSTNYLDVYREADGKYLGTVRINIDEAESAVVGSDGYVQILCNTTKNTDYVWKTPLNINDLQ